jgi:UDP-GlcNAc:undecaprenyl-phosphate GlcNAc-1-phosphate transferase
MQQDQLQKYLDLLPLAIIAFIASTLLTPLIGALAKRFGFVDLPKEKRPRTDKTLSQRIHKGIKLRLGGLGVLFPFIILVISQASNNPQIMGMIAGLIVLLIVGALDDKFELSAKYQFIGQIVAALLVILSGVTITQIDIAGQRLKFDSFVSVWNLGLFEYTFIFPGAIITLVWILTIINAINWMCGIDAIGEVMTFIASLTTMLLAIRADQPELALISAILGASILGYLPFNFPPSKIISGTGGTTGYGFILAVLAVMSGSKITSAIMLLSLPLIDMIWVMVFRFLNLKEIPFFKRPFMGGNVHLHHRIMALGFTQIQTLFIEMTLIALISLIAFYFGGFSDSFLILVSIAVLLIFVFTAITIASKRKQNVKPKDPEPKPPIIDNGPTPEEKYAY